MAIAASVVALTLMTPPGAGSSPAIVGELTAALHYDATSAHGLPQSLTLTLALMPDGKGVVAARARDLGAATATAVEWWRDGREVHLAPVELRALPAGSALQLSSWSFRLEDGAEGRGAGAAAGVLRLVNGAAATEGRFEASLALAPDRTAPVASIVPAWSVGDEPMLPGETLTVRFSEPVPASAAEGGCELLVNGQATPARTTARAPVGGLALEATLIPAAPLPLGATVALRLAQVADPAGNPAAPEPRTLQTLADAGDITANMSFEQGLKSWIGSGVVKVGAAFRNRKPRHGEKHAILETPARLVGAYAVPRDAQGLGFSVGALSESGTFDAGRSAVIWLVSGGLRTPLFDAATAVPGGPVIEPRGILIDMKPYRGQRVFVVAETKASGVAGMNAHTLLLDGFMTR